MKKVILLLVLLVSISYGGWFSSPEKKIVEIDGENVKIIHFEKNPNRYTFSDSFFLNYSSSAENTKKMQERMKQVFNLVNNFGIEKQYKSFVIKEDKYVGVDSGFPFDSIDDLITYCTLSTKDKPYINYCDDSLLTRGYSISLYIEYRKDNSGNYQIK